MNSIESVSHEIYDIITRALKLMFRHSFCDLQFVIEYEINSQGCVCLQLVQNSMRQSATPGRTTAS